MYFYLTECRNVFLSNCITITGLDCSQLEIELDDLMVLQMSRAIHPDKLIELSSSLAGGEVFLRNLKEQYVGFHCSDYAFMIFHEWKKSEKKKRRVPSSGALKPVLDDLEIDKHVLCQVISNITVSSPLPACSSAICLSLNLSSSDLIVYCNIKRYIHHRKSDVIKYLIHLIWAICAICAFRELNPHRWSWAKQGSFNRLTNTICDDSLIRAPIVRKFP